MMIKKKERERMSYIIYKDIVHRIQEIAVRAEKGNLNDAYLVAFQIGLQSDIADSLKKCKEKFGAVENEFE